MIRLLLLLSMVCVTACTTRETGEAIRSSVYASGATVTKMTGPLEAPHPRTNLDRRIDVSFDELPFRDAIHRIRQAADLNLVARWNVLEGAGVEPETLVTLDLRDITAAEALTTTLEQVSPDEFSQLGWQVEEGVITVSTQSDIRTRTDRRIYDIRDILASNVLMPRVTLLAPGDGSAWQIVRGREYLL